MKTKKSTTLTIPIRFAIGISLRSTLTLLTLLSLSSCAPSWRSDLSEESIARIEQNFEKAGENAGELQLALDKAPAEQKRAVAYLLEWMPDTDLTSLSAEFILENIDWAYKARENFSWCRELPEEVFFNEVLPYANLMEERDLWRPEFYTRFEPYVRECTSIREAIDSISLNIRDELLVDYNTKRSRVDISPFQAINEQMATCTGLSFLLTAAFRSVGIPARFAGTAMWTNMRGNHSWVEVWVEGEWYFIEYYPDGLNKSWFVADAGRADPENPLHWIYAVTYRPGDCYFPMSWSRHDSLVHAYNVTDRYIRIYQQQLLENPPAGDETLVKLLLLREGSDGTLSNDRIHARIVAESNGEQADFGFSPSPTDDLNKFLILRLKKSQSYTLTAFDADGQPLKTWSITTDDRGEMEVKLAMRQ